MTTIDKHHDTFGHEEHDHDHDHGDDDDDDDGDDGHDEHG